MAISRLQGYLCRRIGPIVSQITIRAHNTEAEYEIKLPYKLHRLEKGPSIQVKINSKQALWCYSKMQLIRRVENTCATLYSEKQIRGFCHLYSGQEAVAVGIKAAMRPEDELITAYRCHGFALVMGLSPAEIIAELTGKKTGCSRGKGGSMHIYKSGFYGGNGIVGAQVPLGTGVALALKYSGSPGLCVTLYGDGAANQGQVFEAFNIATLLQLPVIFICENNLYGMGTSAERASSNFDFYTRGDYLPGIGVDGMNVLAVREATSFCIDHITSGKGPIVMEATTYRYFGHSMSDPGTSYRTREEIKSVRQARDPIAYFKELIITGNLVSEDELKAIDNSVKHEVEEAVAKAKEDPEASMEELTADIYSSDYSVDVRGVFPWDKHKHKRIGVPFIK